MDTLDTFRDNITHYQTKSIHFLGLMNSATKTTLKPSSLRLKTLNLTEALQPRRLQEAPLNSISTRALAGVHQGSSSVAAVFGVSLSEQQGLLNFKVLLPVWFRAPGLAGVEALGRVFRALVEGGDMGGGGGGGWGRGRGFGSLHHGLSLLLVGAGCSGGCVRLPWWWWWSWCTGGAGGAG